jgi:hypothetical protein
MKFPIQGGGDDLIGSSWIAIREMTWNSDVSRHSLLYEMLLHSDVILR